MQIKEVWEAWCGRRVLRWCDAVGVIVERPAAPQTTATFMTLTFSTSHHFEVIMRTCSKYLRKSSIEDICNAYVYKAKETSSMDNPNQFPHTQSEQSGPFEDKMRACKQKKINITRSFNQLCHANNDENLTCRKKTFHCLYYEFSMPSTNF